MVRVNLYILYWIVQQLVSTVLPTPPDLSYLFYGLEMVGSIVFHLSCINLWLRFRIQGMAFPKSASGSIVMFLWKMDGMNCVRFVLNLGANHGCTIFSHFMLIILQGSKLSDLSTHLFIGRRCHGQELPIVKLHTWKSRHLFVSNPCQWQSEVLQVVSYLTFLFVVHNLRV